MAVSPAEMRNQSERAIELKQTGAKVKESHAGHGKRPNKKSRLCATRFHITRVAGDDCYHWTFSVPQGQRALFVPIGSITNAQLFMCPADDFDCTLPVIEQWFWPEAVTGRGFHHLKQTDYSSYIFNGQSENSFATERDETARVTDKPFSSVKTLHVLCWSANSRQ